MERKIDKFEDLEVWKEGQDNRRCQVFTLYSK
jgi:hypothetical protein